MTPLQQLRADWEDCTRCPLCKSRKRVVICRGKVPADIVFIGEAPGDSEDTLGSPFVGPAGHLQDRIIKRGIPEEMGLRVAFSNLVGCMPKRRDVEYEVQSTDGETSIKTKEEVSRLGEKSEPYPEEIRACAPRLQEFIRLCDPSLIFRVGAQATTYLDRKTLGHVKFHKEIRMVDLVHPAAILRANYAQRSLMEQRNVVIVSNAVREVFQ